MPVATVWVGVTTPDTIVVVVPASIVVAICVFVPALVLSVVTPVVRVLVCAFMLAVIVPVTLVVAVLPRRCDRRRPYQSN